MSRFDNPYDAAEYAYEESERREAEDQRREDQMLEEYRERRREKEADEAYAPNDPKRSDYLDRLYDCEE